MLASLLLTWAIAGQDRGVCGDPDWFAAERCEDRACVVAVLGPRCAGAVDAVSGCVDGAGRIAPDDVASTCHLPCAVAVGERTCTVDPSAVSTLSDLERPGDPAPPRPPRSARATRRSTQEALEALLVGAPPDVGLFGAPVDGELGEGGLGLGAWRAAAGPGSDPAARLDAGLGMRQPAPLPPPVSGPWRTVATGTFTQMDASGDWVCVTSETTLHCLGRSEVERPLERPAVAISVGGARGGRWVAVADAVGVQVVPLDDGAVAPPGLRLRGVRALAAGGGFLCATAATGTTCTGDNTEGQLGDGSRFLRAVPVEVHALGPVDTLVSGDDWSCTLHAGRARCWGDLDALAEPAAGRPVEVELPGARTLAADGRALCWIDASAHITCLSGPVDALDGAATLSVDQARVCGLVDGRAVCASGDIVPVPARAVAAMAEGLCVLDGGALRCVGGPSVR